VSVRRGSGSGGLGERGVEVGGVEDVVEPVDDGAGVVGDVERRLVGEPVGVDHRRERGLLDVLDRLGVGVDLGVHELHVGVLGRCGHEQVEHRTAHADLAELGRRDQQGDRLAGGQGLAQGLGVERARARRPGADRDDALPVGDRRRVDLHLILWNRSRDEARSISTGIMDSAAARPRRN